MLDFASATSVAPRSISALIAASCPSASSSRWASSSASRWVRSTSASAASRLGLGDGQSCLDRLEVDDRLRELGVRVLELGLELLAVAEDLGLAPFRCCATVVDVVGGGRRDTPHEEHRRGDQGRGRAAEVPGHLTPSCAG